MTEIAVGVSFTKFEIDEFPAFVTALIRIRYPVPLTRAAAPVETVVITKGEPVVPDSRFLKVLLSVVY